MPPRHWYPLIGTATLAAGCGGTNAEPTFADDVAALVYRACTPCHRPGGPTPFALRGYDDVSDRRDLIAEVTLDRLMPPWLPTHGDFVGDRRLSDDEIDLLQRWVDAGAPRGDPGGEPPCPEFPGDWQLGPPDLVVELPEPVHVPADGPDLFRNFVAPVPLGAPRFVDAVEIRPGNRAVHHAVLVVDTTPGSRRRDALDAEPGFPGMDLGSGRPPDGWFLGWTPGKATRRSAPGTAWQLQPGSDLVLQLHMTPTGKPETVRPRIGLYFTDVPPAVVAYPLVMFSRDIDLPPGATDVAVGDHFELPVPVTVHSVYPHAHYLCREMTAWATLPGGERRELLRIDRWDFDWQDDYRYRTPIDLPAGTRIEFEYRYDNSAANPSNPSSPPRHVRIGDRSIDEMANLTFQVTTADLAARRTLGEASIRRDLAKVGFDPALLLELAGLLRETGRVDEALATLATIRERLPDDPNALCELGTCLAAAGRVDEAERSYADCIARDPTQDVARVQLGNLLLRTGRAAQAIAHYEAALTRNPNAAAVHNNLATALLATGVLDRAEQHYRRTLELDPTFFLAWFNLGRILTATGRADEARRALQRALALRPGDPRALEALREAGG